GLMALQNIDLLFDFRNGQLGVRAARNAETIDGETNASANAMRYGTGCVTSQPAPACLGYSMSSDFTCQISRAYSAIVRSDENCPMPATFSIALAAQPRVSTKR